MTTDDVKTKVLQLTQTELGWTANDTLVTPLESLKAGGCRFYLASHKQQPGAHDANYAVLPGGAVVSDSDPATAARILDACGSGAPAGIWAEIFARFHPDAAPGTVVYEAKAAEFALSKAARAGFQFKPPAFAPGVGKTVEFFLMDFESSHLYHVRAARRDDGTLEVTKRLAS